MSDLERKLQELIENNEPAPGFKKSDFLKVFHDEVLFNTFSSSITAHPDGYITEFEGRKYVFKRDGKNKGARYYYNILVEENTNIQNPPREETERNDNPEDWMHLAAHIAMMLVNRSACISMPKLSTRGSKNKFKNVDMIGMTLKKIEGKSLECHLCIEVKAAIENHSDLIDAILQSMHGGRDYNESWLVAPISSELHQDAKELGQEYGVGIIAIDESYPAMPLFLSNPRFRAGDKRESILDVLSDDAGKVLREKENWLKETSKSLSDQPSSLIEIALNSFTSDQNNESIYIHLPSQVQNALRSGNATEKQKITFSDLILNLLKIGYDNEAPEEATRKDFYLKFLQDRAFQKIQKWLDLEITKFVIKNLKSEIENEKSELEDLMKSV
jgi:hypothetical protein